MFSLSITRFVADKVLVTLRNSYKSSISLDKLYPKADLDSLSNHQVQNNPEKFSGYIPIEKLKITLNTCSKPGGQHVNKTKSGVEIRFNLKTADWIPEWIRQKLYKNQISRINKNGDLIIKSEKTRKMLLNQADCMEQIRSMIFEASKIPKGLSEEEIIQIEINKKIADGKRLVEKRRRSERISMKRKPIYDSMSDYYGK